MYKIEKVNLDSKDIIDSFYMEGFLGFIQILNFEFFLFVENSKEVCNF